MRLQRAVSLGLKEKSRETLIITAFDPVIYIELTWQFPLQMMARDRDALTILLLATDDGHVDTFSVELIFSCHHGVPVYIIMVSFVDAVEEALRLETSGCGVHMLSGMM